MVNEGYAKVKHPYIVCCKNIDTLQYRYPPYYLWMTDMYRLMMSVEYMDEFNKVPRSYLRLTVTVRHSGKYTGMDIEDIGMLGYDVCARPLSQNIGSLAQLIYDPVLYALQGKINTAKEVDGKKIIAIRKSSG